MANMNLLVTTRASALASASIQSKPAQTSPGSSKLVAYLNEPEPSFWMENGMIWPLSNLSMPWGATDYGSLVAWIHSASTSYGALQLMPPVQYAGQAMSATDLPIAYVPVAMPHLYPFLVWATPHVLPFWSQALDSLVAGLGGLEDWWSFQPYYFTQGPLLPASSLPALLVNTPQGNKNVRVGYVGIAPAVPPPGGSIFFGGD
jgi:hypothetical protein